MRFWNRLIVRHPRAGRIAPLFLLASACTLFGGEQVSGTWANQLAVLVAVNDSVTIRIECTRLKFAAAVAARVGSFALQGNFDGLNRRGRVTITGSISPSTIVFDMRPSMDPEDSVQRFTVERSSPLPEWYPDKATCAD